MKLPVILLHGALGSAVQLEPLAAALSSVFEVHTLYFEGHGTRSSDRPFSIDAFSENVIQFMEENGITKANFFGYSMGGYVALTTALNYPEKVGKIFTYGTKFDWTPESSEREVKMLNAEKILEKVPQFAQHLIHLHGENNWKTVLQKTGEMMLDLGHGKAFSGDQLRSIHTSVRLSVGSKDHMVSVEETAHIADILPNAKLQVLEDWTHPVEKLDTSFLTQALEEFYNA